MTGRVTGIDLSEPLLAVAREHAASMPHLELVAEDAATFPYPAAAYDAIVSRFGLMLFAAPERAFAHLADALRPNGRVVFAPWAERSANAWTTLPVSAVAAHVPMPEGPSPGAPPEPCAFSLSSPSRIHELCGRAWLTGVRMAFAPYAETEGVRLPAAAWIVSGRRAR